MNQQQQPTQTHQAAQPNQQQQVPDHRYEELRKELTQLKMQNQQLRGHLDAVTQRQTPQGPQEPASQVFKPEVVKELQRLIGEAITPVRGEMQNQLGMVYDATDEAKFRLHYGDKRFEKYLPRVEEIRTELQAQGKWIPREQALQMAYFEDTGKKPAPAAPQAPAPQAPVFDPYLQTYVDPATQKPYAQNEAMPPQGAVDPTQQQVQTPQQQFVPQWQQPVQQQAQPQHQPWQPQPTGMERNNPYQHQHYAQSPQQQQPNFQLPQQGMNPAAMPEHQRNQGHQAIDLESSESQLDAFEKKFGDIPL